MSIKGPTVLVTGSTGFLGSRIIEALLDKGYQVRALARKTSKTEQLEKLSVEICYGDVADPVSLEPAFVGINCVIHAAADTKGNEIEGLRTTIKGTQNIASLSIKHKIDKLVYISSCAVYGISELENNQIINEDTPLERHPEKRGFYSEAKLKAEKLFLATAKKEKIPFVCLRPGTIFGKGGDIYTPMMGFSAGTKLFAIIGNGKYILPLVYIDNLVEAIILAINDKGSTGQTYNVVDPDRVTKKEYVDLLLRKLYRGAIFLYIPYWFLYTLVWFQEILTTKIMKRKPYLTRYRLISSQKSIIYDSSKMQKELNWRPQVTLREAISEVLTYETKKKHNLKIEND